MDILNPYYSIKTKKEGVGMALVDEFTTVTEEYDNNLYNVFKKVIDKAKLYSKQANMDPIETFIHVNKSLEDSYIELSVALGITSKEKAHFAFQNNKAPLSEKLQERLFTYIEPITNEARNAIKLKAKDVLSATSLEELQEKYNSLLSILSKEPISKSPYLYEGLEFTKKKN